MAPVVVAESLTKRRQAHGRRGSIVRARARDDHRLPRPERRRQDDHAADAARPGGADKRGVALWGAIGVGLASILRNQIGAVIGLIAWSLLVENLLFGLVPSVGRFTPGRATDALMGMSDRHLLPAAAGGAVLVAWAVVLAAVGIFLTARRDVN